MDERETALSKKHFWLCLLVVNPLENAHMSAIFLRRCDLSSGPIPKAWQCQRQRTLILLSASYRGLVGPDFIWPVRTAHLRREQSGRWQHGVELTRTHKSTHHDNVAVHNNLMLFFLSTFFSHIWKQQRRRAHYVSRKTIIIRQRRH